MTVPDLKRLAADRVEALAPELLRLSYRIHEQPELAFTEIHASEWSAELLSAAGFHVEAGVAGLPTAVSATAGSGPLQVVFCAEYDALPGIGHACGHNVICAASVGAAIAAASVADAAGLTVTLLGTPGEELFGLHDIPPGIRGAGKALLLEAGVFDAVHAALMCHPAPVDIAVAASRAITRHRVRFAASDAAASPLVASRADLLVTDQALALYQCAITSVQTHAPPGCTVHLVQAEGVWGAGRPEQDGGMLEVAIWGERLDDVEAVAQRLDECAVGIATATGIRADVQRFLPYAEMRHDVELAALYRDNAVVRGRVFPDLGELADHLGYATDLGTVSQRVPAIHPFIGVGGQALNHDPGFAAACVGPIADQAVLDGAMALAWTAIDASTTPAVRDRLLARAA